MTVIGTNSAALRAQRAIESANTALGQASERLSTGKRINSAKDDAAGLAIVTGMTSQIRGMEVGQRNALDGISLAQTAESTLAQVEASLQRLRELALLGANGTNNANDRAALQAEFVQTVAQIDEVLETAQFNGTKLFSDTSNGILAIDHNRDGDLRDTAVYHVGQDETVHRAGGKAIKIQTGANATDAVMLALPTLRSSEDQFTLLGTETAVGGTMRFVTIANIDLTLDADVDVARTCDYDSGGVHAWGDPSGYVQYTDSDYKSYADIGVTAAHGLDVIDAAIAQISNGRVALGAMQRRLESVSAHMQNGMINLTEARSRIEDADFSAETTNLAKNQILSQASTAMLAQANASQRDVLKLIE